MALKTNNQTKPFSLLLKWKAEEGELHQQKAGAKKERQSTDEAVSK